MQIELIPCEDGGYEVISDTPCYFVGYVFPDIFGGWRPYSYYGKVMNAGYPAYCTPLQAAYFA